ncbi:MAG: DUF5050 domain-containing protein [Clostridia bacterium]|nr:DUF5050 domain-containing protein [Clostridia bacterium]
MEPLQRLQFDSDEQISRKEYLKRKRKNSKLLKKRSKITYMLMASFMALAVYIVIQLIIYKRYNSFKYTLGDQVNSQSIYSILFVTEGYTYDPVYSVSSILSSGEDEKSILPSSDLEQISVTEECMYGIKEGTICKISRDGYQIEEIIKDNAKKYIVQNGYIFYTSGDEERLKTYNLTTGETKSSDLTSVQQILANDKNVFGITHTTSDKSIYRLNYDGQDSNKISGDEKVSYAIIDENTIYFVNRSHEDKIYKVGTDGNGLEKVADIKSVAHRGEISQVNGKRYMFIKDKRLYYINAADEDTLWCYDFATGDNSKIISSSIEILQNVDNTIFYKIDKEMGVYLYNYDTKFMALVTKRRVKEFVIDTYVDVKQQPSNELEIPL